MSDLEANTTSDAVEVRAVEHVYRDRGRTATALNRMDLSIPSGQFLAIVGPSGCGKTTLLNAVAGLFRPSHGRILVDGSEVTGPRRSTGYMFARDSLLPWRTALANVEFALEIRGVPKRERRAESIRLLQLVNLEGAHDAYPSQLSQGMRQRVAIARTLAIRPSLLLLDEPFAALDAETRRYLQQEFVRIWEEVRHTVILVTHDLAEAILLADRVIVLTGQPGSIREDVKVQLPRPRDLEELPFSDEFTRTYRQIRSAIG